MKKITLLLGVLCATYTSAQTWNTYHQNIVDNVTLANVTTNINEFVAFGEKNASKTTAKYNNLTNSKNWLKNKYQTYGYANIVEDNFTENGRSVTNLVITKTGSVYPNTFVIIDAHYDTINGVGANDNGSGTSLLLEIARIMKNVPTEYSIKFIHFAGEEHGLNGSNYYANNAGSNINIRYVFNIDEVGGVSGMTNDTIVCEKDTGSPSANNAASATLTNELANSISMYSSLNTEISYAYASDYMPFEDNGHIITGLYEKNETPYKHSSNDIISNMDIPYVYEITKGSLGALLHFALANQSLLAVDENNFEDIINIYPNPVTDYLTLNIEGRNFTKMDIQITDVLGKTVWTKKIKAPTNSEKINLQSLPLGVYILDIHADNTNLSKKIIINH